MARTLKAAEARLDNLIRLVGVTVDEGDEVDQGLADGLNRLNAKVDSIHRRLFGGDAESEERPLLTRVQDLEKESANREGRLRLVEDAARAREPERAAEGVKRTMVEKIVFGAIAMGALAIATALLKLAFGGP